MEECSTIEIAMTEDRMQIILSGGVSLSGLLSKEMIEALVKKWQEFQSRGRKGVAYEKFNNCALGD